MTHQKSLSYEDLEPEGEDVEAPNDHFEDSEGFEDEDLQPFLENAFDEYGFESESVAEEDEFNLDLEEAELANEQPGKQQRKRRRRPKPRQKRTIADLAACTALAWGRRRTTATSLGGNGHRSPSSARSGRSDWAIREEYLDELEEDLFEGLTGAEEADAWSAALWEDYELMVSLAKAATATNSREEAEGFAAAMVPLSVRLAPHAYRAFWPVLPTLIRGVVGITRLLRRQAQTRRLLEVLPVILVNTTTQLAQYVAHGQPVTQRIAAKVLARQTALALRHRSRAFPKPQGVKRTADGDLSVNGREWWDSGYDL